MRGAVSAGIPLVVTLGESRSERTGNFVTIISFSVDGEWVAYNDPVMDRVVRPTHEFEAAWEIQGLSGVVVRPEVVGEPGLGATPLIAAIAAIMGLTVLTPSVLETFTSLGKRREGIGRALMETDGVSGSSPPSTTPAGKVWVQVSSAHYENGKRQVTEYVDVPNEGYKKVMVGTVQLP